MFETALALRKGSRSVSSCCCGCSLLANSEYKTREQEGPQLGQRRQDEPLDGPQAVCSAMPTGPGPCAAGCCVLPSDSHFAKDSRASAFWVLTRFLRADPRTIGREAKCAPSAVPLPFDPQLVRCHNSWEHLQAFHFSMDPTRA